MGRGRAFRELLRNMLARILSESPGGGVERLAFLVFSADSRDSRISKGRSVGFLVFSLRVRSRSRLSSTSIRHSIAFFTSSNA